MAKLSSLVRKRKCQIENNGREIAMGEDRLHACEGRRTSRRCVLHDQDAILLTCLHCLFSLELC